MQKQSKSPLIATDGADNPSVEEWLPQKEANELFIGLCGPIGVDLASIQSEMKASLESAGYTVAEIKLSKLFSAKINPETTSTLSEERDFNPESNHGEAFLNYRLKQKQGNHLREQFRNNIGASLVFEEVRNLRQVDVNERLSAEEISDPELKKARTEELHAELATNKRAYIINQLKRPEEVETLRGVYKSRFYLYAGMATENNRKSNLLSKPMNSLEAEFMMTLDRKENGDHGQRVEKTVLAADFFHNCNQTEHEHLKSSISRFIELIHGFNGHAPTQEEFGMHQAHAASLGSLCLSRQVGAAILDKEGNIMAVGRNDVPKFGGGLYETNNGEPDDRCVKRAQSVCSNDHHKNRLKEELKDILQKNVTITETQWDKIYEEISENSKVSNLIEYSRSVHAEMDAIISIARKGTQVGLESTLFTTVFPCHNCARHIVAAGIKKVIYIEPYEKSLAIELHNDSISLTSNDNKVEVKSFHGVAPRIYPSVFGWTGERKKNGKPIGCDIRELRLINTQHVIAYLKIELAFVASLQSESANTTDPAPTPV